MTSHVGHGDQATGILDVGENGVEISISESIDVVVRRCDNGLCTKKELERMEGDESEQNHAKNEFSEDAEQHVSAT